MKQAPEVNERTNVYEYSSRDFAFESTDSEKKNAMVTIHEEELHELTVNEINHTIEVEETIVELVAEEYGLMEEVYLSRQSA